MAFKGSVSPPCGAAGSVAAGMVAAILWFCGDLAWGVGVAVLAAVTAFAWEKWKSSLAALALGAAAGFLACVAGGAGAAIDDVGRRGSGGEFVVDVTGGGSIDRAMTTCRIEGEGEREFMLRPPAGAKLYPGGRCRVEGRLSFPSAPPKVVLLNSGEMADFDGMAGFDRYLTGRGRSGVLYARSLEEIFPPRGAGAWFYGLRLKLSERLAGGLPEREGRMLNAVIFGMSGGLGRELAGSFMKSGALHLFSVSGMHIAMAAFLVYLACRFLPWRWQGAPVLAVVWFYTLLTGANVPAVRAAIMISAFTVASMVMFRPRPISVWALAMALVLGYRPFDLYSAGFQFSFLITFFLLLAAEARRRTIKLLNADWAFMPLTAVGRSAGASGKLLFVISGACLIFLVGLPISLIHQNLCTPAAILMNIFLAAYSMLLFPVAGLKMLLPGVGVVESVAGWTADLLCKMAEAVSSLYSPAPAVAPPAWSVPPYLALLALFLIAGRTRVRLLAALGVAAWLFAVFGAHVWERPFAVACSNGGVEFIVAAEPAEGAAVCFGAPPYKLQAYLNELLARRGVRRIDLCVTDSTKAAAELNCLDPDSITALVVLADKVTERGEARIPEWLPWRLAGAGSAVTFGGTACRLAGGSKFMTFRGHDIGLSHGAAGTPVKLVVDGEERAELWNSLRDVFYIYEF